MSYTESKNVIHAYRADDTMPLLFHFHNAYELIFIKDGIAEFIIDEKQYVFEKNSIIFLNQMEKHQMIPKSDKYIRYIMMIDPDYFNKRIGDEVLSSIFLQRPNEFQNGFILAHNHATLIKQMIEECVIANELKKPYHEFEIMAKLTEILIILYREYAANFPAFSSGHIIKIVSDVRKYLDAHYLEDITLYDISKYLHINKFHLMKLFKQVTGYTIKQYIILKQVAYAKNMLFYTDYDIAHIASMCGFNSASNFIRTFQTHENITPARFRKRLISEDT